jgi:hypothetical protein
MLSYKIHDMFFTFTPSPEKKRNKLQNALYVLSIKEFNLDGFLYRFLSSPFRWIGHNINFIVKRASNIALVLVFLMGALGFMVKDTIPEQFDSILPVVFSILGLLSVLAAFSERGDARRAWWLIMAAQGLITLSITFNAVVPIHQILLYLSGIAIAAVPGYIFLKKISKIDNNILLDRFHGYSHKRPVLGFAFFISCLCIAGFPFTPTFLGIDLLFTHINKDQVLLTVLTALSFIFIELTLLRIYARIFLGPHKVNDHPIALKSA